MTPRRETFAEQLSRVRSMSDGDPTWDLSARDVDALAAVLTHYDALRAALLVFAEAGRGLAPHDDPKRAIVNFQAPYPLKITNGDLMAAAKAMVPVEAPRLEVV